MLKTVKNGSGIRVDPHPPVFSKFPHFPVFSANVPYITFIFKIYRYRPDNIESDDDDD